MLLAKWRLDERLVRWVSGLALGFMVAMLVLRSIPSTSAAPLPVGATKALPLASVTHSVLAGGLPACLMVTDNATMKIEHAGTYYPASLTTTTCYPVNGTNPTDFDFEGNIEGYDGHTYTFEVYTVNDSLPLQVEQYLYDDTVQKVDWNFVEDINSLYTNVSSLTPSSRSVIMQDTVYIPTNYVINNYGYSTDDQGNLTVYAGQGRPALRLTRVAIDRWIATENAGGRNGLELYNNLITQMREAITNINRNNFYTGSLIQIAGGSTIAVAGILMATFIGGPLMGPMMAVALGATGGGGILGAHGLQLAAQEAAARDDGRQTIMNVYNTLAGAIEHDEFEDALPDFQDNDQILAIHIAPGSGV